MHKKICYLSKNENKPLCVGESLHTAVFALVAQIQRVCEKRERRMKANYHTHTMRCQHASGEDKEYVEAAIAAGIQILGFSDHCPWIYPDDYVSNIRMVPSEVEDYVTSLERLRREYRNDIEILIGFEAEYMTELLEEQDRFLADYPIDYMILGQHFLGQESNFTYSGRMSADEDRLVRYVDQCIEGIASGRYAYLAHPDLIYYAGADEIYAREMRRLCKEMKEKNVPLEMNLLGISIHRNYPDSRFWKIAKETGNQVIFGRDAHDPKHFADQEALKTAEKICSGMTVLEKLEMK